MVTLPFPSLNFFVASGDDFKTFQKAKKIYYEQKMQIFYFCGALLLGIVSCRGSAITCKGISDLASPPEEGGKITMEWESNTAPKLAGYRVSYGSSSGKYKSCVDVGKATEPSPGVVKFTLTGLNKGKRYYLALIAYDTFQNTSEFSKEVSAAVK
jgi:hypothetical protein